MGTQLTKCTAKIVLTRALCAESGSAGLCEDAALLADLQTAHTSRMAADLILQLCTKSLRLKACKRFLLVSAPWQRGGKRFLSRTTKHSQSGNSISQSTNSLARITALEIYCPTHSSTTVKRCGGCGSAQGAVRRVRRDAQSCGGLRRVAPRFWPPFAPAMNYSIYLIFHSSNPSHFQPIRDH